MLKSEDTLKQLMEQLDQYLSYAQEMSSDYLQLN